MSTAPGQSRHRSTASPWQRRVWILPAFPKRVEQTQKSSDFKERTHDDFKNTFWRPMLQLAKF
jgi:hypothetical protein